MVSENFREFQYACKPNKKMENYVRIQIWKFTRQDAQEMGLKNWPLRVSVFVEPDADWCNTHGEQQ